MTEPSQYFKGRTVQEQMNEVIGYVDVRSAEVATDAIAADVAQVHSDAADAHADALAAAASAAAATGTLANAVKKTGEASQSIAGDIAVAGTLSGGVVTGTQVTVPAPVNNTDATTKKYVDDADALLIPINDINNYAVGLTGNQVMSGVKKNTGQYVSERSTNYTDITVKRNDLDINSPPASTAYQAFLSFQDRNGQGLIILELMQRDNGTTAIRALVKNSNGTSKYVTIASGDVI